MGNMIIERMPTMLGLFCAFLAFFIPFIIYKINERLHKDADPPWKKQEKEQSSSN